MVHGGLQRGAYLVAQGCVIAEPAERGGVGHAQQRGDALGVAEGAVAEGVGEQIVGVTVSVATVAAKPAIVTKAAR